MQHIRNETVIRPGTLLWMGHAPTGSAHENDRVLNAVVGRGLGSPDGSHTIFGELIESEREVAINREDALGMLTPDEASAWITGRIMPEFDPDPAPELIAYIATEDRLEFVSNIWIVDINRAAEHITDDPGQAEYDSMFYGMRDHASPAERADWAVKFGITPGTMQKLVNHHAERRSDLAAKIKGDYNGLRNRINSWTHRDTKREITARYNHLKGAVYAYSYLLDDNRTTGVFRAATESLGISWDDWTKLGDVVRTYTQNRLG